ncbi:MAG: hypothetical protein DRJ69_06825 [Thermoprotei archaeon]|nr:MAG: hypothetical protein DRJ69_06825 [Thermoprotei archaeon]
MHIGVLASLVTLLGVPALCFIVLLIVKRDLRETASALKFVATALMLFIPFICYCLLAMYINLKTTDLLLATLSLALLFFLLLPLIKLVKSSP